MQTFPEKGSNSQDLIIYKRIVINTQKAIKEVGSTKSHERVQSGEQIESTEGSTGDKHWSGASRGLWQKGGGVKETF